MDQRFVVPCLVIGYAPRRMGDTVTTYAAASEINLQADMTLATRSWWAWADLRDGMRLWRLAWALGWLDIRLRYRGSMLGPFWLTISTGVMIGALGVLYSALFKIGLRDYLPFLALSQVLWGFLSSLVSEACSVFTDGEGVIRSVRMPFFVFSIRALIRNAIVLGHNIIVIIVVFAVFRMWPGPGSLLALPGLVVWAIDALALTLLLGSFCARFRDIQPIVGSVMQIAFFMTPVIWKPEQLGAGVWTLPFNPFYDVLQIVRGPILGTGISPEAWVGTIIYSFILCVVSWFFFAKARGRITFWV